MTGADTPRSGSRHEPVERADPVETRVPTDDTTVPDPDQAYQDLRKAFGRLLAADRRLRAREQQRRNGTLSHAHTRALFVLMQQHEVTAGTLAKAAELNPASVTAMIDHLEAEGLVQRRRDQQDRRQCWVSLTDTGRKQVEEKERNWRARLGEALADVTTAEVAVTSKVLMRLAAVMEGLSETSDDEAR